ncbi:ribonuclease YeeF family protein, partial [Listeria monocytogenes]
CPPAGLALAVGYGSLEAGSAISGKDWVSGRELSAEERALRGGLALLDIVPGVKALSTGAKAASAGSKLVRVGDNVLAGSKNVGKGTIDNGIQAGKQAMDLRLANAKKVSEAVQKKLTKDLDDIGTMAKTIQNKTKETFTLPPREQLAFAGGGSIPEQSAAGAASIAAKKKLKDIMQNMDNLNVKGGGKAGIIEGAENSGKYLDDIEIPDNMKKWDYPPSKELFKKYEEVYKNPKYYNQETGAINWPPNNGFIGETHERLANVGEFFDRYGEPSGEFLAKSGFSFEERALAPHSETSIYYKYRVEKPFKIIEGETAPWFDQKGGATQLYGITEDGTVLSVEQLIDEEYLELVN